MTIQVVENPSDLVTNDLALNPENPIGPMLLAVTSKGITPENAAALEKLTDLYLKLEGVSAKKQFAISMSALQAELPRVVAGRVIPDNEGNRRSSFAAYEDIMGVVGPHLRKHGFSVSFNMKSSDERMCAVCTITHSGGHSQTNEFAVRVGTGPPKASAAQADGAARSYARRGALCDALNIVVDHDDDARMEGDVISMEQASQLRRRLMHVKGDEKKFLEIAGVNTFEEIRVGKLSVLQNLLRDKEKALEKTKPTHGAGTRADTPSPRSAPASAGAQTPSQPTGSELADIKAQEFADGNDASALRKWLTNMRSVAPKKLEAVLTVCQIGDIGKASEEAIKRAARDLKAIMIKAEV